MRPSKGGGFGVLGKATELNFLIEDETKQKNLELDILEVATDESFIRDAGFKIAKLPTGSPEKRLEDLRKSFPTNSPGWSFFELVNLAKEAKFVFSKKGGAAGYLKVAGDNDSKLRIAITPDEYYLSLSRSTIIKHELGHFVREAKVAHGPWWVRWRLGTVVVAPALFGGLLAWLFSWWVAWLALYMPVMWFLESKSLFEQERRRWCFPYNLTVVMPREEWLVWWFTMSVWQWRLGMVFALTIFTVVAMLYAKWFMGPSLDLARIWGALGVGLMLIMSFTLLAWRR